MSELYFLPRPHKPNAPTTTVKTYASISNSLNVSTTLKGGLTPKVLERLTPREAQVAMGLMKGLSVDELALQLDITIKTLKFHKTNIYKAYNVKGIAQFLITIMALGGL